MVCLEFASFVDLSSFDQVALRLFKTLYDLRLRGKRLKLAKVDPIDCLHVFEGVEEVVELIAL